MLDVYKKFAKGSSPRDVAAPRLLGVELLPCLFLVPNEKV